MAKTNSKRNSTTISASDLDGLFDQFQLTVKPASQQKKVEATSTMMDVGIDGDMLERVMQAVTKTPQAKRVAPQVAAPVTQTKQEGDARGVGSFKKYEPKEFRQLAESADGKIAITIETRDWEMTKGKNQTKSGTSTKIHIRSKYVDRNGDVVYGYDLGSFSSEKETLQTIAQLLQGAANNF